MGSRVLIHGIPRGRSMAAYVVWSSYSQRAEAEMMTKPLRSWRSARQRAQFSQRRRYDEVRWLSATYRVAACVRGCLHFEGAVRPLTVCPRLPSRVERATCVVKKIIRLCGGRLEHPPSRFETLWIPRIHVCVADGNRITLTVPDGDAHLIMGEVLMRTDAGRRQTDEPRSAHL